MDRALCHHILETLSKLFVLGRCVAFRSLCFSRNCSTIQIMGSNLMMSPNSPQHWMRHNSGAQASGALTRPKKLHPVVVPRFARVGEPVRAEGYAPPSAQFRPLREPTGARTCAVTFSNKQ